MLTYENVSLTYRGKSGDVPVLRDVSFEVPAGKVFAILGPSGSGKSSLLRLANRLRDPDDGRVLLDGEDVRSLDVLALRRRVGMLFQEPVLFGESVEDNLRFASEAGDPAAALEQVGLPADLLTRGPGDLSVGQKQRVTFARALLAEPEVLLLDEPTSALDPRAVTGLLRLVRDLRDRLGLTIVFVTHVVAHAKDVADRFLVLSEGEVLEEGGPELLTDPARPETRAFLDGEEE